MSTDIDKGYLVGLPKMPFFGYPFWLLVSVIFMIVSAFDITAEFMNSVTGFKSSAGHWFQRSGAASITICAIVEALIMVRIHRQMRGEPTLETERGFLSNEEIKYLKALQTFGLFIVSVGTVVWGYGDLLHQLLLKCSA